MNSKQYKAWLQYDRVKLSAQWVQSIVCEEQQSTVIHSAINELSIGIEGIYGLTPTIDKVPSTSSYIHIGTVTSSVWKQYDIKEDELASLGNEGYVIRSESVHDGTAIIIIGSGEKGVLYGAFHLLRKLQMNETSALEVIDKPLNPIRMINHWDNADGSIERGYAGNSIFYKNGQFIQDLQRVRDYARMLSSVGMNAISINNVNVHETETHFITKEALPDVARIAKVFRSYGIQLYLSINFAAPVEIGSLSTADPLDIKVKQWWKDTAKVIYEYIPDFGGFIVKADSEHRPGPFTYGRDHKDGANMLADALEPYGGIVIWRCFVYNCMQDWRDRSTDRARAAYDHFKSLDGEFKSNVLLQVKNGPMDFQVREPVSPLFGGLVQTNHLIEFQITQEYTGQQKHLCYLIPQWKEVLDFDTYAEGEGSEVKNIMSGQLFNSRYTGCAAVSSIGNDDNWTGHTLAQANLYGCGRLFWNPDLSAEEIADEWIQLTFGLDQHVREVIRGLLLDSWPVYESYTAPLGVGWMVTPHYHYGPDVDGYEYSRWGTYHFADREGIGVDRTVESGTGYTSQYYSPNFEMYDQLDQCPDELLLFFHHVPYTHQLKSGVTVIQHIYNTHFDGAAQAEKFVERWGKLHDKVDEERYQQVLGRFKEQAAHAKEWRDVINTYFYRKSGIVDEQGRTIY